MVLNDGAGSVVLGLPARSEVLLIAVVHSVVVHVVDSSHNHKQSVHELIDKMRHYSEDGYD